MTAAAEFRQGWPVVAAGLAGVACGLAAIPFYTLGLFAPHLRAEFGWGQGEVMAALSVLTVVSIVAAPVVGLLARRHARRTAIVSLVLFGLGLASLALTNGSLVRWYAGWALLSLAGAGTLPITWTRAITARFDRARGLALGVALAGTGLFGFLGKPLAAALIDRVGWRGAWVGLALLPLLVAVPLAAWLFREEGTAAPVRAEQGWTVHLRAWRLWLLVAALLPTSFALAGSIPNMEAILRGDGLDERSIRAVTPFIGLATLVGRLVGGWLLDRFWAPGVAFVLLCLPAAALLLLAGGTVGPGGALLAVILVGLAIGVEYDVVAYLVALYFPRAAYGPLYGIAYIAFVAGAGLAPAAFGRAYDVAGSFAPVLRGSAILLVAGAALLLLLGRAPLSKAREAV